MDELRAVSKEYAVFLEPALRGTSPISLSGNNKELDAQGRLSLLQRVQDTDWSHAERLSELEDILATIESVTRQAHPSASGTPQTPSDNGTELDWAIPEGGREKIKPGRSNEVGLYERVASLRKTLPSGTLPMVGTVYRHSGREYLAVRYQDEVALAVREGKRFRLNVVVQRAEGAK